MAYFNGKKVLLNANMETTNHNDLSGREQANQHPITAITGLSNALDAKGDKANQNINGLDYGVVGDGETDDTAAIQALLDNGGSIYLPDRTYKINTTLSITVQYTRFICDGTISYTGAGTAIKSEGQKHFVRIKRILAPNGTGLSVVAENNYSLRSNYIVHTISAKKYGVYLRTSDTWSLQSEQCIYYCNFFLDEVLAEDAIIMVDNKKSTANTRNGQINENHFWLKNGRGADVGVCCRYAGAIRFHELSLENLHGNNTVATAGILLDNSSDCEFSKVRWADSENSYGGEYTKSIKFVGNCGHNVFYKPYELKYINSSGITGDNANYIYSTPIFDGKTAHFAIVNSKFGVSYKPMDGYTRWYSNTHYPNYTVGIADDGKIATGIVFNSDDCKDKEITIGEVYSDFVRSAAAGTPLTLFFYTKSPSFIKDINGQTIIDNSDDKYNGKTVVIQCTDRHQDGAVYVLTWAVSVVGDDIVKVRQTLGGKQDAISDLAAIRSNASAGAAKVSCTDATVGSFGYTKVTDNHINSLIDAKLGVIENGSY